MQEDQNKTPQSEPDEPFDLEGEISEFFTEAYKTFDAIKDLLDALDAQSTCLSGTEPEETKEFQIRIARTLLSVLAEKAEELSGQASERSEVLDARL